MILPFAQKEEGKNGEDAAEEIRRFQHRSAQMDDEGRIEDIEKACEECEEGILEDKNESKEKDGSCKPTEDDREESVASEVEAGGWIFPIIRADELIITLVEIEKGFPSSNDEFPKRGMGLHEECPIQVFLRRSNVIVLIPEECLGSPEVWDVRKEAEESDESQTENRLSFRGGGNR